MSPLFVVTYVIVFCLILAETLVLYGVLRRVMWLHNFYDDAARQEELDTLDAAVDSAPQFSLPSLQAGEDLSSDSLKGAPSLLCFVSPGAASAYRSLVVALGAWWQRMEGRVYLVCNGAEEPCKHLVAACAKGFPLGKVIYDQTGLLARTFHIVDTPQAVELDSDLRVSRFGRPETVELEVGNGEAKHGFESPRRGVWPDDRPISGAGFARVDTPVSCVLSRFRLRSPLLLIPFYFAFRRVRHAARSIEGLMEAVFLYEGPRTCYTLSFWRDDWSIVQFGDVRAHIDAANSVFSATHRRDLKRAEIWSAQFRLWAVSCHNLNWEGLDLKVALGDQWHRREEVARMTGQQEGQRSA